MKIVRSLVCFAISITLLISLYVPDAKAFSVRELLPNGTINCDRSGKLFEKRPYNHFHFQRKNKRDDDIVVTVNCASFIGSRALPTFPVSITIDDNKVYELFLEEEEIGEDHLLLCDAGAFYYGTDNPAPVKYSATRENEHEHDHGV
ncbi:hypothetical protein CYANOKiyG1_50470 [Okeania sp. KiyG1]|nr:hypothetical protein CYANOKiyG1_50470 [Okeania sp. KiyG1]